MDIVLDEKEARILGCLIEKEITTPEYYPLSLNSLTNACNQKSNRNPVVSYYETAVARGLDSLQLKGLTRMTHTAGSRVPKYLHTTLDHFDLSGQEIAILCELMLRGPQTVGEIRTHTERMYAFQNLEEVEKTLQVLTEQDPPLAAKLPREAGRKECRYMHLFSGASPAEKPADVLSPGPEEAKVPVQKRIIELEEELKRLKSELEELKQAFAEFKSQF
ncbi:MAG: YceH family protein [Nitrospirota bacterium]|nr:YceH family protein [Nitrospirota bacterium]